MSERLKKILCVLMILSLAGAPLPAAAQQRVNASPVIQHDPVTRALKGAALTLKAKVTDDVGVKAVTLYYTLSKDAAPFRVEMHLAGLGYYLGTIEGSVLSGATALSYYIEAEDTSGAVSETAWSVVAIREAKPGEVIANAGAGAGRPTGGDQGDSLPLGLIAGGAVAVVGGALLIANGNDGGGGGDGGGTTDPGAAAGTYSGSATTCLTMSGQSPSCEGHGITIVIDSKGKVLSNNLREGQSLTDTLDGSSFTLVATINGGTNGVTGEIFYNGTVVGNKIVGSISGSQEGGIGGAGSYSGSFTATRQ